MQYEALIDDETLAIYDRKTNAPVEAVAVIPDLLEDLEKLVSMVPPELAGELARLAAWQAMGREAPPPSDFEV